MKLISNTIAVGLVVALAACSGSQGEINSANEKVDTANESFASQPSLRAGGAQISEGVFVAAQPTRQNSAAQLPSRLRSPGAVTFQSRSDLSIAQIMGRLTEITDLTHVAELGPDAEVQLDGSRILEVSDLNGIPGANAPSANGERTMRPNFRGSLPDVLNRIGSHFDLDWSYENDRIVMRDHTTRDYQIASFASTMTGSLSVGDSGLTSSTDYSVDFLNELRETITQMAGPEAQISISPSTGIMSLNTTLRRHTRVSEHLARFNEASNIQIAFDVNIVNVSRSAESSASINLASEINRVISGPTFNPNHSGDGSGRFAGSAGAERDGDVNVSITRRDFQVSAAINALAGVGNVSVETRTGATTLNNRPIPLQVVEDISYAASTSVTRETQDDGTTRPISSVSPGTVTVGYQIQLLPRVLNNRDIQVQYGIELSDATFRTFDSGDNSQIELPEVSRTNFMQQAMVENGQTIVLAGFERRRNSVDRSAGVLRIQAGGSQEIVSTVIFITPRIIDRRRSVDSGAQSAAMAN